MTTLELYSKGARVWIPNPDKVWEGAELIENYQPSKKTLDVINEDNVKKTLQIKKESDLPHLRNPPILIGKNDFTSLSYLHEPAVLYNLRVRYCQNNDIYTYCGIVLVAINPYYELPIYGVDTIHAYRGRTTRDLDPHIFAVAEEAYTKLERESKNQSIIVSGESGAGKTVSAKYAMRYFATVGGSTTETQIEKKVLASSPIMEAIGNAKTTRNDNSSRFGKYIELQFNEQYVIVGASMRTYLLEKTRVVFQAPEERNYHIFYQICAARNLFPHLYLEDQNNFHYLNQGNSPYVDGVDDLKTFEETLNAFNLLGFNETEKDGIFKIIGSILHLGNIQFEESIISMENEQDQEGCSIPDTDKGFEIFCKLLDIDSQEMRQWLCIRKLTSMREIFHKPMSIEDATASRDALAKYLYSKLFNWIVNVINKALETKIDRQIFIGVLDIYGFETFEINSFEQFCINYANEKLQQQFNLYVFKLEQQEYIKEGIEWKMIDFYDNQPCIDLIEAKLGVLDLLDEECRMPKGTDGSWTEKLYSKCIKYSHFGKARFGTSAFTVSHFADKVEYQSSGFLEKNRDAIIEEQISVLKNSRNKLVVSLFVEQSDSLKVPGSKLKIISAKPRATTQKQFKQSVGSQFRDSLNKLMTTLNATTPHYVRCIKPNDTKTSFGYNPQRTVQQLRACGVLETIRLSAAGYPSRWTYVEFFHRYRVLAHSKDIKRENMQLTSQNILEKYIKQPDMFHFGKTKIFFRAGQVAYLEKLRSDKLLRCCITMQSTIRAFICRKKYLRIINSVHNVQRYARGYLARRKAQDIRRNRAAIVIQKYVRSYNEKKRYEQIKDTVYGLQKYARGYLARKRYMEIKFNEKATIIQKYVRGYLARKAHRRKIRNIVICQSVIRRFLARRLYKKLRIEARSIEHIKNLNKGLENKIISLQHKVDEVNKHNTDLKKYVQEAMDSRNKLALFKAIELENRNLKNLIVDKNKTIDKLKEDFKLEQDEKMDLLHEQDRIRDETESQQKLRSEETCKLRKELDDIREIVRVHEKGAEKHLKEKIEEEKLLMLNEQDNDRHAYQKLLQNYNALEQHCEKLEKQISSQNKLSTHARNISDASSISIPDQSLAINSDITEDHGYGTYRSNVTSNASKRANIESIDWKVNENNDSLPPTTTHSSSSSKEDTKEKEKEKVGLVLQLQHKLSEVDRERDRLQRRVDEIDLSPKMETITNAARDAIRIGELELLNSNLKSAVIELEQAIKEGNGNEKLNGVIETLQDELNRKSEEIVQLKSVLANQSDSMKSMISNSRLGEYINEDGELALAYETQKTINKQLELELQDEKARYKAYEKEYILEIERLRKDNERQQQILSSNLDEGQKTTNECYLEQEVTRLTTDNLEIIQKNHNISETVKKLKKQVKYLTKKLRETGTEVEENKYESLDIIATPLDNYSNNRNLSVTKKKDIEYMGMFAFKAGDENEIMRQLVYELKPRTAMALLPGLPAYIVFMCVRHTDYINDEEKVKTIMSAFASYVKKTVKKKLENFEVLVLWLANTLRLLHTMKQYSGEKTFTKDNDSKQNKHCLKNFDLTEYRQLYSDIAVWIYQALIRYLQEKIHPLIVPAILDHEEVAYISGNKPISDLNKLINNKQKPTLALVQELTNHYKLLTFYEVENEVISQIFKQLFYFLCASSLNNLLLRRDSCNWTRGFQMRHNLSHFEMWTRDKNLDEEGLKSALQPIIQAAHLLQARKTDEDVGSICEMCTCLNPLQICKILHSYAPIDEFETCVPPSFIMKVEEKLKERPNRNEQQTLLMDTNYNYPVRFPFKPSNIRLEEIEIPEVLKLPMLERI